MHCATWLAFVDIFLVAAVDDSAVLIRDVPFILSRWGFDAPFLQFLGNGIEGSPAKEEFVDDPRHQSF